MWNDTRPVPRRSLPSRGRALRVTIDPGMLYSSCREPALPSTVDHHMETQCCPVPSAVGLAHVSSDQTTGIRSIAAPAGRAVCQWRQRRWELEKLPSKSGSWQFVGLRGQICARDVSGRQTEVQRDGMEESRKSRRAGEQGGGRTAKEWAPRRFCRWMDDTRSCDCPMGEEWGWLGACRCNRVWGIAHAHGRGSAEGCELAWCVRWLA